MLFLLQIHKIWPVLFALWNIGLQPHLMIDVPMLCYNWITIQNEGSEPAIEYCLK